MMRIHPSAILATLAVFISACGGSGSTGLITAENPLLVEVRETGECRDANGTTYCSAEVITIAETQDPDVTDLETNRFVEFDTRGIDDGTACAVATRRTSRDWSLGLLKIVGDDISLGYSPASGIEDDPAETALLCFDAPPDALPETTETLAELEPTIIYVAPLR